MCIGNEEKDASDVAADCPKTHEADLTSGERSRLLLSHLSPLDQSSVLMLITNYRRPHFTPQLEPSASMLSMIALMEEK
jgi:hypothetical protein